LLSEVFENNIEKMCNHIIIKEGRLKVIMPEGIKIEKMKKINRSLTTLKKRNIR
jgi:hypothetical protein